MGVSDLNTLIVFVLPGYVASTITRLMRKRRDVPSGEKLISCLLFTLAEYLLISFAPGNFLREKVNPLFNISPNTIASNLSGIMLGIVFLLLFSAILGFICGFLCARLDPRIEAITGHIKDHGLWNRVFSPRPNETIWAEEIEKSRKLQHVHFVLKGELIQYQAKIDECDDVGEHLLLLKDVQSREEGKEWKSLNKRSGKMLISFDQIKYIYLVDPRK